MKKTMYSEAAYLWGIIALAFGTALMERADFGVSMVVAPAYLVYLKVSRTLAWFTFGMAEYCLQALLTVVLSLLMKSFRKKYLYSFITAVVYGTTLDLMMKGVSYVPGEGMAARVLFYVFGLLFCAIGVSMFFHSYISPEAYEMFVKEIAGRYGFDINKTKTAYDCTSCAIAVVMSFWFFGCMHFEGVKAGTIVCS
ncbi:MAG: DUF6198 family protein, partial [Candidatus Ornithospirochaeta sp.]